MSAAPSEGGDPAAAGGAGAEDAGAATRKTIRGSGVLLGGQAFGLLVNLATQILIIRYLTRENYGAFAYVLSVITVAQVASAFGLFRGVSRFMPMYEERGELGKAAGTFLFAFGTVTTIGLAVVCLVIAFRSVIAGSVDSAETVLLLTIMIAMAPMQSLGTLLDGVFAVYGRPRAIALRKFIVTPLIRLAVVGILIFSDGGVLMLGWGYLASEVLGLAFYSLLLIPLLRKHGLLAEMRSGRLQIPAREILSFTTPLMSTEIAAASSNAAGVIVLGALAGASEVADLRAVYPIVQTMGYVLTSFGILFLPLAVRLHSRGDPAELNRLFWQVTTWITVLAYPIFVACVLLAEPITVLLFGERYEGSAPLLAILALGQYVNVSLGPNVELLGVYGRVRFVTATNLLSMLVSVSLALALVPAFDAFGAAVAYSITYVLLNLVRQAGLVRGTSVHALDRGYALVWLALATSTGGALAAQILLDPPLLASIAMALACYAIVLAVARPHLRLAHTFPELARLPLIRAFAGRPDRIE